MAVLFQAASPSRTSCAPGSGHIAGTLGGVNYERRGGRGCVKGSAARGATNPLFRHHFHLVLSDEQAARAKKYADGCVGRGYLMGGVPTATRRGDCSGYIAGIHCAAMGRRPRRLCWTGNWTTKHKDLGFRKGLGAGVTAGPHTSAGSRPGSTAPRTTTTPRWTATHWSWTANSATGRSRWSAVSNASVVWRSMGRLAGTPGEASTPSDESGDGCGRARPRRPRRRAAGNPGRPAAPGTGSQGRRAQRGGLPSGHVFVGKLAAWPGSGGGPRRRGLTGSST